MSTADLTAWYAYYTSSRPDLPRAALEGALAAEVGLPAPPSYAQVLAAPADPAPVPPEESTAASAVAVSKGAPTPETGHKTLSLPPGVVKGLAVAVIVAVLLGVSVRYSDNGSVQTLLQQLVQILGQYVLKSGAFVYQSSVRLLEHAADTGSEWLQRVPPLNPFLTNDDGEFKTQVT